MRSAITLVWLSLGWTLLCFLLYRDREVILQASVPVWVVAAAGWMVWKTASALVARRRAGGRPATSKSAASVVKASGTDGRRTPRSKAAKSRKRTS